MIYHFIFLLYREWIAPMVALKLIHELVEHNDLYTNLLDGLDWIIVPILNIDGYIYTHEVVSLSLLF